MLLLPLLLLLLLLLLSLLLPPPLLLPLPLPLPQAITRPFTLQADLHCYTWPSRFCRRALEAF
jgi:hypothetical protein